MATPVISLALSQSIAARRSAVVASPDLILDAISLVKIACSSSNASSLARLDMSVIAEGYLIEFIFNADHVIFHLLECIG